MFIYQHVKAIQEQRFQKDADRAARSRQRSSNWGLRDLLGALSERLDDLGFRDVDGESFPASPAH